MNNVRKNICKLFFVQKMSYKSEEAKAIENQNEHFFNFGLIYLIIKSP